MYIYIYIYIDNTAQLLSKITINFYYDIIYGISYKVNNYTSMVKKQRNRTPFSLTT